MRPRPRRRQRDSLPRLPTRDRGSRTGERTTRWEAAAAARSPELTAAIPSQWNDRARASCRGAVIRSAVVRRVRSNTVTGSPAESEVELRPSVPRPCGWRLDRPETIACESHARQALHRGDAKAGDDERQHADEEAGAPPETIQHGVADHQTAVPPPMTQVMKTAKATDRCRLFRNICRINASPEGISMAPGRPVTPGRRQASRGWWRMRRRPTASRTRPRRPAVACGCRCGRSRCPS